ncbi:PLDc N-terminal domain-containing protein [Pedococcus sp. KACC 23699]|uniref:PLDc N-terminal domain-containing protein n=1 Tax=Pedococcus sp. KACC 23699 TaxID=3149228 RepID=A0AAU7JP57_9MICO
MLRLLPWLATVALTVYAVVDCIQTEDSRVRNLPKLLWILLVLLFPLVGPIAWLIAGRPSNANPGQGPRRQGSPPRGPDDDPDFLRRL